MSVSPEQSSFFADRIDKNLVELASKFHSTADYSSAAQEDLEEEITNTLAVASHKFFDTYPATGDGIAWGTGRNVSPLYSPKKAQEYGTGNCIAHTIVTGNLAQSKYLRLQMRSMWDGMHASSIWMARRHNWSISGDSRSAHPLFNSPTENSEFSIADLQYGGRFYYYVYPPGAAALKRLFAAEEAPKILGERATSFPRTQLILPINEAEIMFTAIGDLLRYQSKNDPQKIQSRTEHFNRFVPPTKKLPDVILPVHFLLNQQLNSSL